MRRGNPTDNALVIDAYEFNPINWQELASDDRIAGFINKASDGLPPEWSCGDHDGDDYKLCKNRWWKYSVTKELYMTRREMAKMKGLLWGAYHLGRPGNPREQADHFVDFAEPAEDDLIALDIEDNSDEWMSLSDAEIFADQIKIRTGRYPVLYTNGSTAKYISQTRRNIRCCRACRSGTPATARTSPASSRKRPGRATRCGSSPPCTIATAIPAPTG